MVRERPEDVARESETESMVVIVKPRMCPVASGRPFRRHAGSAFRPTCGRHVGATRSPVRRRDRCADPALPPAGVVGEVVLDVTLTAGCPLLAPSTAPARA